MRCYLFTILILFSFLFNFSACGGGSSDSEEAKELENRLSGNTYNAVGFEEITATVNECVGEEVDDETNNPDITISFGPTIYTINIDGEIGIGAWQALDEDTIEIVTSNDEVLEIDINIVETTIFLDLSEDWRTQNCSSEE